MEKSFFVGKFLIRKFRLRSGWVISCWLKITVSTIGERDRIESDWKFFEDGKFRKKKKKSHAAESECYCYQLKNNRVTCVSLNRSWKSNHKKKKTDGKIGYSRNSSEKKKIFFKTDWVRGIIVLIKINRVPWYFFETPWNAILWNRIKINGKTSKLENVDTGAQYQFAPIKRQSCFMI